MSDARIQAKVRDLESVRDGIRDNLRFHEQDIGDLEREYRAAGRHTDAYLRQQDIERRISTLRNSITSAKGELLRIEKEIDNLR